VKVRLKKIQTYLVIAILFNILFPPFMDYYDLMKDSFLPPILIFENPEQEIASTDYLNRPVVFDANGFPIVFLPVANLFDPLSNSSFQIASLDQETFVLRC
jgi:hypothetical protein